MSYIGNSPGVASQRVTTTLTATASQTVFTTQSGYVLGYVDVYLNGVKLVNGADFEAITGTFVTLFTGALVGDVVELVSYIPRGLSDGYTKSEADAKFLDVGGDTASGTINLGTNGLVVGTNQLVASGGFVGIGTATPAAELEVSTSTGSAAPIATEIRISSTTSGSDWSNTLPWARLGFYSADSSAFGPKTHAAIDAIMSGTTGGSSNLAFSTYNTVTDTFTEKLRILNNGDVGIGTISPSGKFEVSGGRSWFTSNNEVYSIAMRYSASTGVMYMGATNSVSAPSIQFSNAAGSALATIDYSGNLGLGATPSAWGSGRPTIEFGGSTQPAIAFNGSASNGGAIWTNAYYNGTANIYKAAGYATRFDTSNSGAFGWFQAASGAAGAAATFIQTMTLNASGRLGLGNSAPSTLLHAISSVVGGASVIRVDNSDATASSLAGFQMKTATHANVWQTFVRNNILVWGVEGSADYMLLNASGNVGIGVVPDVRFAVSTTSSWIAGSFVGVGGTDRVVTGNLLGLATIGAHNSAINAWAPFAVSGTYVVLQIGGVEKMRLDGNGALGIGTNSPGTYGGKLAVHGTASTQSTIFVQNPGTGSGHLGFSATSNILKLYNCYSTGLLADGKGLDINTAGSCILSATNSYLEIAPNSSWGKGIRFGGNGNTADATYASMATTNGNIHIDSTTGASGIYLNWYSGSNGVYVGNGTSGGYGEVRASAFSNLSDYRLKEDIQPVINALTRILTLNPVNFAWKSSGIRIDGFIAHEVKVVVPDAVSGEKDAVYPNGDDKYQGIDHSKLVPLLVKGMQEQQALIESLTTRLTALENK